MKFIFSLAGLFMLVCGVASAAMGDEPKDHVCFSILDADGDGRVTFAEYNAYYKDDRQGFDAADTDGNGTLSHDEYHDRLGHGASPESG